MEPNKSNNHKHKKKTLIKPPILIPISLLALTLIIFFSYPNPKSNSDFNPKITRSFQYQCQNVRKTLGGEKYLWYAPHSGFSNQLSEFKNAVLMGAILNRTVVVPPVLDHHAVVLGSCPKFRVTEAAELRMSVWSHALELIRSDRYVSMADVVDLSSLVADLGIRFLDFRYFISIVCGVDIDFSCSKESNGQSSLFESLRQCGSLLSGYSGNIDNCLYALDKDCRTTVWTFQKDGEDGQLDSFQPDEQLKKKKKVTYIRRRQDIYKALGPGSEAEFATVLSFGSLFTGPYKGSQSYIDISEASRDQRIESVIEKIKFIPFAPEITNAGKEFAQHRIKSPFLCAQLRLLDGQFKNHWKGTFLGLKQKLELLRNREPLPIHIFVMTDLPVSNWTGNFLGDLASDSDSFKLIFLRETDELVRETAKKLIAAGSGLKFGSVYKSSTGIKKRCSSQSFPDILLYIEETICSCASLGFVGTAGSTIAESIEIMRKFRICSG